MGDVLREVRCTLCLVLRGNDLLLGQKKKGLGVERGKVLYNAPGGIYVPVPGRTMEHALEHEVEEEVGIHIFDPHECGILRTVLELEEEAFVTTVYRVTHFAGIPHETDEMAPAWFPIDRLPFDKMWSGDRHWLPSVLRGSSIAATLHYFDGTLAKHHISTL
ncbi:MAG: 8-oxo-dGTP diphosphatase [Candidatus Andersenbacteria bacterium]